MRHRHLPLLHGLSLSFPEFLSDASPQFPQFSQGKEENWHIRVTISLAGCRGQRGSKGMVSGGCFSRNAKGWDGWTVWGTSSTCAVFSAESRPRRMSGVVGGGAGNSQSVGASGEATRGVDGFGYASPRPGWICRRHLLLGMRDSETRSSR